jgi:hypothetical protein
MCLEDGGCADESAMILWFSQSGSDEYEYQMTL